MKYKNIREGIFLLRENRFIAKVMIDGETHTCHVKNTGRCRELLLPNCRVFLEEFESEKRKTKFDLISVYKGERLINIDSQVPNKMFHEFLESGGLFQNISLIKREVTYKNSRFDFYVEYEDKKCFIEIKGVTLERDSYVLFPDAPTDRGVKHLRELIDARRNGYDTYAIFIIQMNGVKYFIPNYETHKEFGDTLRYAKESGVNILAFDSYVTRDEIRIKDKIEVIL